MLTRFGRVFWRSMFVITMTLSKRRISHDLRSTRSTIPPALRFDGFLGCNDLGFGLLRLSVVFHQAQFFSQDELDFLCEFRVFLQKFFHGVAALANALIFICKPRSRLRDNVVLNGCVDEIAKP